jgi:hypothetical protein
LQLPAMQHYTFPVQNYPSCSMNKKSGYSS